MLLRLFHLFVLLEIIIGPNGLVKLLAIARSEVVRFAHSEVFALQK